MTFTVFIWGKSLAKFRALFFFRRHVFRARFHPKQQFTMPGFHYLYYHDRDFFLLSVCISVYYLLWENLIQFCETFSIGLVSV